MKAVYLKNFRKGLATNSSSTHSLIYRNDGELFKDLDIFETNYYDRFTSTIAASREAKIKYVLADIMYNEPLVKIMSSIYPEMKQYFPLIKDEMEDKTEYSFGMYCRGNLAFPNNIEASVDYLKNVIEDDDIIIVGGSDEADFVYDTIEGHVECPDPDMIEYSSNSFQHMGVTKNGNYWVGYGDSCDYVHIKDKNEDDGYDPDRRPIKNSFCGKIRFATSKGEIVPDYPELIDLKITNACEHGCPMCYMDATMKGKHADVSFLKSMISNAGTPRKNNYHRIEFSIGGGNILLYPNLEELFQYIKEQGHIINVTINAKDCKKVIKDKNINSIFMKYVDGIGVSVFSVEDADILVDFKNTINKGKTSWDASHKYIVAHLIPEYLGVELTNKISNRIKGVWMPVLYLGYKPIGRGETQKYKEFTKEDLLSIFKDARCVSIDTTFANRYFWWIKDNFSYAKTMTLNEGEFSMYIDGVSQQAYKSSYNLEKPYNMKFVPYDERENNPMYSIKEAFAEIRKDGGFKTYDEINDHYYSDAKHYWEE